MGSKECLDDDPGKVNRDMAGVKKRLHRGQADISLVGHTTKLLPFESDQRVRSQSELPDQAHRVHSHCSESAS